MNALIALPLVASPIQSPMMAGSPDRRARLNHEEDSGDRPALPTAWPKADDSVLLKLEEQIFEHHEAATADGEEISRLGEIRSGEHERLYKESLLGRCPFSEKERRDLVDEMPESKERDRLVGLQERHCAEMLELIEQMWTIPARTPEDRRAKVLVLLGCIMPADWRVSDESADYGIREARDLLIEFVGGEPAAQLRDQFAA
jgi:hypothetical protein